uniref:Putative growth hormone-inducible soluble protein n=1 Tax=Triatoma dimidiata TaxID=72491 RepID=A0A0V0G9C0_TRIDM
MSQRAKVIDLYKTLLHLGKDYPQGFDYFRSRLKKAFLKNKDVTDPERIQKMIAHGEFVKKEIEALYMLKKYRTLKRRYNDDDNQ